MRLSTAAHRRFLRLIRDREIAGFNVETCDPGPSCIGGKYTGFVSAFDYPALAEAVLWASQWVDPPVHLATTA